MLGVLLPAVGIRLSSLNMAITIIDLNPNCQDLQSFLAGPTDSYLVGIIIAWNLSSKLVPHPDQILFQPDPMKLEIAGVCFQFGILLRDDFCETNKLV